MKVEDLEFKVTIESTLVTGRWVKIGEVVKLPAWRSGVHQSRYAVMEYRKTNGMRKYKEVYIASDYNHVKIDSQIETFKTLANETN